MKKEMMKNPDTLVCGGRFGYALAKTAADANPDSKVVFAMRNPEVAAVARTERVIPKFFGDNEKTTLPENIEVISLAEIHEIRGKIQDLFIPAFPAQAMREALSDLQPNLFLGRNCEILSASKGIEEATLMMMHEVIKEVLQTKKQVSVLLGGNLAADLAAESPMITELAGDKEAIEKIKKLLNTKYLEIYLSQHRRRLDIAGPVKNIHSLAAGMCSVLYGDSTIAAIKSRGLAELERIAYVVGFKREKQREVAAEDISKHHSNGNDLGIFAAGGGITNDYMLFEATRNFWAGKKFAEGVLNGKNPQEIIAEIMREKTVESLTSAIPMSKLVSNLRVKSPIIEVIAKILQGEINLEEAKEILTAREWRNPQPKTATA
jgi:glycerol-3-phosphate dehydrogenase